MRTLAIVFQKTRLLGAVRHHQAKAKKSDEGYKLAAQRVPGTLIVQF
jgi:hypothetical protein